MHGGYIQQLVNDREVEAAKCAKLTDLFGAGFTSPAAAGAPGDERGGLDSDERVEADMVDHLTCESLRSCSPSVHVRGLLSVCLYSLPSLYQSLSVESPLVWLTT
ncbi:unnamed protein product [Pleuronectes platessa]|uniref:Uncharacterized protein n=1 Tax=Pleuronectes platessa TaxID=8262 RepID=A0A9N7Z4P7_PLEPL|nr:unnamed protein product [Pleuronectes platessa]